ncbi:MAG: sugar ABC transporter permease [Chloroflexi bacterium]|nr:sugar ABC transporter permease [Chloroflexota bacterium]
MSQSLSTAAQSEPAGQTKEKGWEKFIGMRNTTNFTRMLILPAQLLLIAVVIFPLLMEVYLSLTSWAPTMGGVWWDSYKFWDWGKNYGELFQDKAFWMSIWRTILIVGIAVPLEFFLGLGIAFLFLEEFRGKGIFHTITLTPMMVVPAVAGYMFFMLFQIEGPINAMLSMVTGLDVTIPWLSHQYLSVVSVILADVWQWTPLMFLILLSGLLAVPEDQLKAATILGASFWHKFRYLMWPIMKPVVVIALVLRFMEAIKIFDSIMLMTAGGPARATETISVYMYKIAFQNIRWSYAAAAAIVILVIMTIVATYALKPLQAGQADDEF